MNIPAISVDEMREIDRLAPEEFGIDVPQMMETAGRMVAVKAFELAGIGNVAVLCGKGHNGGDGLVAARYLKNWGANVTIILASHSRELRPIVKERLNTAKAMQINVLEHNSKKSGWSQAIKGADLIVDSLIGYNLKGDPREEYADIITLANKSGNKILSVDCPSGLDSDTGNAGKPCITATSTIALTLPKKGLFLKDGKNVSGEVLVADMGIPQELYREMGLKIPRIFKNEGIVKA